MAMKAILATVVVVIGFALYQASNSWERAYATYDSSEISPDGCFRIDTYEPFWILPSMFHRSPDPDPTIRNGLGRPWGDAIFKRAYEIGTGELLGETVIFDPVGPPEIIDWGRGSKPGRRVVVANGFPLFDSSRCSDDATLAKLEAYYERQREANQPLVDAWRKQRIQEAAGNEKP
jgi:hypothetical protein